MAEIKIEKKKPIWPWIILVLVILAILYFLVFANDDGEDDMDMDETEQIEEDVWEDGEEMTSWDEETDTTGWATENDTLTGEGINAYLTYVADTTQMGKDHQYTNMALIHLMNAVQAKADEMNFDITVDMQPIRQDAQAIEEDPASENHANKIKQAGTRLAEVIEKMQQENYPDLSQDVQDLKAAANSIDGSVPTLDQKEQVKTFFQEAADVLQKMS